METCEVTFDETQSCSSSVFECATDDEISKKIFEHEEDEAREDDGNDGEAPTTHVHSTSTTITTVQDGLSPTLTTIQQYQMEAVVEGEVVSRREAPKCVLLFILPQESSTPSMNVQHGQGPGICLTLLIQLVFLPLSLKTLDTHSLILIR
jgi:hypothetical protein